MTSEAWAVTPLKTRLHHATVQEHKAHGGTQTCETVALPSGQPRHINRRRSTHLSDLSAPWSRPHQSTRPPGYDAVELCSRAGGADIKFCYATLCYAMLCYAT